MQFKEGRGGEVLREAQERRKGAQPKEEGKVGREKVAADMKEQIKHGEKASPEDRALAAQGFAEQLFKDMELLNYDFENRAETD